MIRDFWYSGVGVGVDAFSKMYNAFYMREGVFAFHSHNLYLQILAEMGIWGILSFLALVIMTVKHGITAFINTKDEFLKTIIASLIGGMVAFLFHGIFENSFYNFKLVFSFWFVISIVSVIKRLQENEVKKSQLSIVD
jgi:O-antigen ligase